MINELNLYPNTFFNTKILSLKSTKSLDEFRIFQLNFYRFNSDG